jgi:DNA-binding SARP family transcriptional activator
MEHCSLIQHCVTLTDRTRTLAPLLICVLGNFRIIVGGSHLALQNSGKARHLLGYLALHYLSGVSRDTLLETLWPMSDSMAAGQCLNSLTYSLHKTFGEALDGAPVVLHTNGRYRLNSQAGVGVDLDCFQALLHAGKSHEARGNHVAAVATYEQAERLYDGDLCIEAGEGAVIEREHLRARFLTMLVYLAHSRYCAGEYSACLGYAFRILQADPYREDAHRLLLKCYTRRGERAQALRQYHLCRTLLRAEFDAAPEPATVALFDQICRAPETV